VLRLWQWLFPLQQDQPSDKVRLAQTRYLQDKPEVRVNSADVADLLLQEAKYLADSKVAVIRATEGKAASQVAVLGGGLGILTVLGPSRAAPFLAGNVGVLVSAAVALAISAIADTACIVYGSMEAMPMPDVYNTVAILNDSRMKGRVGMAVAEGYFRYCRRLTAFAISKARLLGIATSCLVAGVLLLVGNSIWVVTHQPKEPPSSKWQATTTCSISGIRLKCEVNQK